MDGTSADCNANGVPDECDLADGTSSDYDADGIPDECEGGVVGTDYATIAEALLDAPDGGVIIVPSGTWTTPFTLDRAVTIIAPDGPEATILSNSGAPRTIVTAHAAPAGAALIGFTITNGVGISGQVGGGLDAIDSYLRLENCVLRGNFGTDGGGARFQGGAPEIVDCVFEANLSGGSGGGLRLVESDATVDRCTFVANEASAGFGLAVACTDGSVSFVEIDASQHAGQAVSLTDTDGSGSAALTSSTIRDNLEQGIAIASDVDSYAFIANTRICGNTVAPIAGPYTDGGGNVLLVDRCPDLVVPDEADTIQMAIDAALPGDRIAVRPGTYDEPGLAFGGRDLEIVALPGDDLPIIVGPVLAIGGEPATALLRGFDLRDGTGRSDLPGREGTVVGGNLILDNSSLVVQGCRIQFGLAELGGGLFIRGGEASLVDCYLTANRAMDEGGGVFVDGTTPTSLSMTNCIVAGNHIQIAAHTRGGGVRIAGADGVVTIEGVSICSNDRENLAGEVIELGSNSICLAVDCDGNGVEDAADIGDLGRPDCNTNLVPDDCDIAAGLEGDCDGNGLPDECELADGASDLDQDGVLDACQDQLVFNVPGVFPTLGDAIDAATDGSRIQLAAGSYVGPFDLGTKNLEIIGDPADPTSTTLETPGLNATVLRIAGGQDATTIIAGVTIENGVADTPDPGTPSLLVGGGVFIHASSPVLEDCIIGTNTAARGGGVFLRDSEAVLRRVVVEGNSADAGGGGIWWLGGVVTMDNCTIRDNTTSGNGGGVRAEAGGGVISGGSITGNLAADGGRGGGLWWRGSLQPLLVAGADISANLAQSEGGGVFSASNYPGIHVDGLIACENVPNQVAGPYTIEIGSLNEVCRCGDINGDGVVDGIDIGLYLAAGGSGGDGCPPLQGCPADVNFDGQISGADIGKLLGDWGLCQ